MYKLVVTELAHQDLDNIVSSIAVYRINEATQSVIILRFFYGAQDYIKLI